MDVGRRASFAAGDLKNAELKRLAMRYSDYVEAEVEDDEISFYPQQSFQPKATSSRPLNLTVSKSKKNITPYQAIRGVVSKNKVRFQEDGFDLDLTYISPQMIAMGFPSSGTEGYYRNQIEEVERFFDKRHRNHYKVYNLCSERTYDTTARFGGNHARYGFDDHNPPVPISIIPMFVKDAQSYLAENPANVIAVHCKAGKGRTGVMLGALMITQSWQEAPPESPDGETVGRLTAADALARFGNARTHDGKGVTIPSQIRYIRYWEDVLRSGGHIPGPRIMKIDVFRIISTVKDKVPTDLYFTINMLHNNGDEREKREVYDSRRDFSSKSAFCNNSFVFDLSTLRHPPTLQGDVLFRVRKSKVIGSDDNLFHFWLNIDIEGCKGEKRLAINLEKNDLDKAVKDKSHETYKEDLAVELRLSSVANRGHAHSALSPQLTSTRNSHLSMTSFFQSPPLVAQISPLLPIEPTTREGSPIGRVGRRSSSPHVYPQLHASFGHSTIKEFNGWLRLQKLHVQRLTVHGLDAPLEAFLKVIVDDVERDTEKKKMSDTGETLAWGPQEVFSISSVTAPHLEFELYVQQRARVQKGAELLGCASIRLTDMLPDVLSWSKHAKSIDTLQNLWSIGLELENDDEATIGLLRIEGAFELPSRVPRGRPEHCVVLAASIAMCCCTRNRRQSWFSPESSVLGTLVDSPCPSSPLGIDSPKRGFASPDGDVSRRPPKTRKKYKPQQAYVGTTQFYPPSGPSKVQGIQLSGTFFTRSEELDAIDLSLVDSFPVASGEKGIRLEGLGEFQLRSTLERNAWLEVLEAAVVGEEPPPLTLGESAITAVEQALLLLESNERAARAELRVEVAQSFSLLRQRHANFSLAQMNRECAALATYARRLAAAQELARKHELERRKARNADHGQTSSRSGSDLSLPVCELPTTDDESHSPTSEQQLSPSDPSPSSSPPASPVSSRRGSLFARRDGVKLLDKSCQAEFTEWGASFGSRKQPGTHAAMDDTSSSAFFVLTVAACTAARIAATESEIAGMLPVADFESAKWAIRREEEMQQWPILVRGPKVVETELQLTRRVTRFALQSADGLWKNGALRVRFRYFFAWYRWCHGSHRRRPPSHRPTPAASGSPILIGSSAASSSGSSPQSPPKRAPSLWSRGQSAGLLSSAESFIDTYNQLHRPASANDAAKVWDDERARRARKDPQPSGSFCRCFPPPQLQQPPRRRADGAPSFAEPPVRCPRCWRFVQKSPTS